jgi:hypothetical protein
VKGVFYRLIKHGQPYVDKGTEYYEAKYREQQIRSLAKRAQTTMSFALNNANMHAVWRRGHRSGDLRYHSGGAGRRGAGSMSGTGAPGGASGSGGCAA